MRVFYYSFSNHDNYDFANCPNERDMIVKVDVKEVKREDFFGFGYSWVLINDSEEISYELCEFNKITHYITRPNNFHYISVFSFYELSNEQIQKLKNVLRELVCGWELK